MTRALITDEVRSTGASMGPVQLGYVSYHTSTHTHASHAVYPVCVCVLCLCERICNKKLLLNARCQLTTGTAVPTTTLTYA